MATGRRMGASDSLVRTKLIEAAGRLIEEEGCAAVTARRLADTVGLKRQIVHYYFRTIEDVFVAVIQREGQDTRQRIASALETGNPLRAIWRLANSAKPKTFELIAKAKRAEAVRAELQRYTEEFHAMSVRALERYLDERQLQLPVAPAAAVTLMVAVSQMIASEEMLEVSSGHDETRSAVEDWLQSIE